MWMSNKSASRAHTKKAAGEVTTADVALRFRR